MSWRWGISGNFLYYHLVGEGDTWEEDDSVIDVVYLSKDCTAQDIGRRIKYICAQYDPTFALRMLLLE